tara:strand:- start:771 stop:1448 length:678 start_codon:yes stop_codon:yes gene_type:complete
MAEQAVAAEEQPTEEAPKKKGPLLKIIVVVIAVLLLIGISVGGTLIFTGFFSEKPKDAVAEQLEILEKKDKSKGSSNEGYSDDGINEGQSGKDIKMGADGKPLDVVPEKELVSPDPDNQRWKFNYYALQKPLLSNVAGSRKVMQVTLTVMTHYDDRVIKNVKTHELALRAGILDVMRQKTESDLSQTDFRVALAEDLKLTINSLLEKYEGFGGIEEVMFTEFVVQ